MVVSPQLYLPSSLLLLSPSPFLPLLPSPSFFPLSSAPMLIRSSLLPLVASAYSVFIPALPCATPPPLAQLCLTRSLLHRVLHPHYRAAFPLLHRDLSSGFTPVFLSEKVRVGEHVRESDGVYLFSFSFFVCDFISFRFVSFRFVSFRVVLFPFVLVLLCFSFSFSFVLYRFLT